jgi:hypothetical protein
VPTPPEAPDAEPQYLYLTTTGWKSGTPHEIEIWFVRYDGCCYLCSEKRDRSHWVQNIQHNAAVRFRVGGDGALQQGTGRVVPMTEVERLNTLRGLFEAKYAWSDGLMVELCPD